jgi:hypothetical protein
VALAYVVVILHGLAFMIPLVGVYRIYIRAKREFDDARHLTNEAIRILALRRDEQRAIRELRLEPNELAARMDDLQARFNTRLAECGLSNKTLGQADVLLLTDGKSNLSVFASAVTVVKSDALLVILGLVLGLIANVVPTIWSIPPLAA